MFKIPQQTEAENDQYLLDCFYNGNFVEDLIGNKYSIISGRKGSGKTALGRFLRDKHTKFDIYYSDRISIDEIATSSETTAPIEELLFFIVTRTVQLLLEVSYFSENSTSYWKDFLLKNGLNRVRDFHSFVEWVKENKAGVNIAAMNAGVSYEYKRTDISNSTTNLFYSLEQSIEKNKRVFIFVDDISDHLDRSSKEKLAEQLNVIRDVLLKMDKFNVNISEKGTDFRFISCIREDLFEYMQGSNINKLQNNALRLIWDEKGFCSLLIKRLPYFESNLEEALKDPIKSIMLYFPNESFSPFLKHFDTPRYTSNFYAYMTAISFNRPRDFLKFCYCMKERLSLKRPAEYASIEGAELEYSDYFMKELKDELYLSSQVLGFKSDYDSLNKLVYLLGKDAGFNHSQLRTELGGFLGIKASNSKVVNFIKELWWYGILGIKDKVTDLIIFKYFTRGPRVAFTGAGDVKDYKFYLHRGIWWAKKKKEILAEAKLSIRKTENIEE